MYLYEMCSCGLGCHLVFMSFLRPVSKPLQSLEGPGDYLVSCPGAVENPQPPSNRENGLVSGI